MQKDQPDNNHSDTENDEDIRMPNRSNRFNDPVPERLYDSNPYQNMSDMSDDGAPINLPSPKRRSTYYRTTPSDAEREPLSLPPLHPKPNKQKGQYQFVRGSMDDLSPLIIPSKGVDPERKKYDEKFGEYWKIILEAEMTDEKAADEFKASKELSDLKVLHFSRVIIMNNWFVLFMIILVLYTLFLLPFKFLCCSRVIDPLFDVLTALTMIFFIVEFTLYLIGDVEFFNSFYFYTDIASIALLVFDFSGIRESFFRSTSDPEKTFALRVFEIFAVLAMIRVIKLIRYMFQKRFSSRMDYFTKKLKLDQKIAEIMLMKAEDVEMIDRTNTLNSQNSFGQRRRTTTSVKRRKSTNAVDNRDRQLTIIQKERRNTGLDNVRNKNKMNLVVNDKELKESKLSRRLLYLTNKRLMMLLLVMLMMVPMFSVDYWTRKEMAFESELPFLTALYTDNNRIAENFFNNTLLAKYKDHRTEVRKVRLNGFVDYEKDYSNLRLEERRESFNGGVIIISYRYWVQIQALLYIFRVVLVLFVFYLGSFYFKKEARTQLLNPLEGMLEKINMVSKNPSRALQLEKQNYKKYNSDLTLIDTTIQKIAYLLVLGFGGAGNDLLGNALKSSDFDMENISQAKTVFGIFGFCDIRKFTDATEVLQGDIMLFVNAIGKVVYEEVVNSFGGANKNIGDAFLVFWKLKNSDVSDIGELTQYDLKEYEKKRIEERYSIFKDNNRNNLNNDYNDEQEALKKKYFNNLQNSKVAELSLISFLKIISRMHTEPEVIKFNKNKKLLKAMPDFTVNLGFGLHAGWAIEGAIGSVLKIDMTYLSPHVNMSARLEGLTKTYGVPLLFTNCLYNLFTTKGIKGLCRRIDRVVVKGTDDPFELFTVDLFPERLGTKIRRSSRLIKKADEFLSFKNIRMDFMGESYLRKETMKEDQNLLSGREDAPREHEYIEYDRIERMFETVVMDKDLVHLLNLDATDKERIRYERFYTTFGDALEAFVAGRWEKAKELLREIDFNYGKESTSDVLYKHMEKYEFIPPRNWTSAREIKD